MLTCSLHRCVTAIHVSLTGRDPDSCFGQWQISWTRALTCVCWPVANPNRSPESDGKYTHTPPHCSVWGAWYPSLRPCAGDYVT